MIMGEILKDKTRVFTFLFVFFVPSYGTYKIYRPNDRFSVFVDVRASLFSLLTHENMKAIYSYKLFHYEEKNMQSWRYFFISNFTRLGRLEKFFDSLWIVFLNQKICEAQKIAFDNYQIKFLDIFTENRRYYFSGDYFYWPKRVENYETCSHNFYRCLEKKQYVVVKYRSKYFLFMGTPSEIKEYINNVSEDSLEKLYQNFTVSYFDRRKPKNAIRVNR